MEYFDFFLLLKSIFFLFSFFSGRISLSSIFILFSFLNVHNFQVAFESYYNTLPIKLVFNQPCAFLFYKISMTFSIVTST